LLFSFCFFFRGKIFPPKCAKSHVLTRSQDDDSLDVDELGSRSYSKRACWALDDLFPAPPMGCQSP
jgi:hypothetical protein